MGLFGKIVLKTTDKILETTAKKVVAETMGDVVTKAAVATIDALGKNKIVPIPTIPIPDSSDGYIGRNVEDVKEELITHGFSNIGILPHRDLINGWLTKPDSIEKVIVDGKENYRKKTKFSSDVRIVIVYHTFKNK